MTDTIDVEFDHIQDPPLLKRLIDYVNKVIDHDTPAEFVNHAEERGVRFTTVGFNLENGGEASVQRVVSPDGPDTGYCVDRTGPGSFEYMWEDGAVRPRVMIRAVLGFDTVSGLSFQSFMPEFGVPGDLLAWFEGLPAVTR